MLTNTVGIVLFILIFTVLTAGGVLVAKRFPIDRETNHKPLYYFCDGGRLLFLDEQELIQRCQNTSDGVLEDEYFIVRTSGLSTVIIPRPGKGETIEQLRQTNSVFRRKLMSVSKDEYFVSFLVHPDSGDVFQVARDMARSSLDFSTGWSPLGADEPASFAPGGRRPTEVQ
jgi:hypothetical protein